MISLRNPCMAPHCIHCINITSSSTSASSQHTLTFFLCTLFTPHTTNLPLGAHKTQKASPTSKQTATCIICILFILIFHQWSRIFSRYQHFVFLFSLYFTTKLASLVFFLQGILTDDRPFTNSTAVTRDLRQSTLPSTKPTFYLHYYRVLPDS